MKKEHINNWLKNFYKIHNINRYIFLYNILVSDQKVAFVPYNGLAQEFEKKFWYIDIIFFDDYKKGDNIFPLSQADSSYKIFNWSQKYENVIKSKLHMANVENIYEFDKNKLSNLEILKGLKKLSCFYPSNIPENIKNIVVITPTTNSDVVDKIKILQSVLKDSHILKIDYENNDFFNFILYFLKYRKKYNFIFFVTIVGYIEYGYSVILKKLFPKVKVIVNGTDYLPDLIAEKKERIKILAEDWNTTKKNIELAYYFAKKMTNENIVDGVVHRTYTNHVSDMARIKSKNIFFPPYLNFGFKSKSYPQGLTNRLIFIGVLCDKDNFSKEVFGGSFLCPIFCSIVNSGCKIDLFSTLGFYKNADKCEQEIANKNFKIFKGEPIRKLAGKIKDKYHWGLLISNMYEGSHHNGIDTLSTKLYTYLGLGLPVIVSESSCASAKIVKDNGLGIIIKKGDENMLNSIIQNFDYDKLRKNVIEYNQKFNLKNDSMRLQFFYKNILEEDMY